MLLLLPFLLALSLAFYFSLDLAFLATLPLFLPLAFLEGESEALMKVLDVLALNIDLALRSRHQVQVHLQLLLCDGGLPGFALQNFRGDHILEVGGERYLLFDELDERVDGQLVLLDVDFDCLVEALLVFGVGHRSGL